MGNFNGPVHSFRDDLKYPSRAGKALYCGHKLHLLSTLLYENVTPTDCCFLFAIQNSNSEKILCIKLLFREVQLGNDSRYKMTPIYIMQRCL